MDTEIKRGDSLVKYQPAEPLADSKDLFKQLELRLMREIYRKLYPKSKTGYARIKGEELKPLAHILMAQTPGECRHEHSCKSPSSNTTKEEKACSKSTTETNPHASPNKPSTDESRPAATGQQYPITKQNYKPPPPPKEEIMQRENLIKRRMILLHYNIHALRQLGYQVCTCSCHYGHILFE